jgi:hypothetical protein
MALRALALASVAGVASSLTYVEYPFDGSTTTGWVEESDNCCSGSVSTSGTTLTVSSSERVYLVGDVSSASSWSGLSYDKLNLLGKTLSWTQDTSKIGCGCNAGDDQILGMGCAQKPEICRVHGDAKADVERAEGGWAGGGLTRD